MNYEGKYKKALKVIESLYNVVRYQQSTDALFASQTIEKAFPELAESEDERIRKAIFKALSKKDARDVLLANEIQVSDALAWLEKQGEKVNVIENFNTEFERQISHLIASAINKEHEYNEGFVKWAANALLNYAKHELEEQGEQKLEINDDVLSRFAFYQYDNETLYLSSVFVEECSRKRGYGSKILKAAEEVAKTFGVSKIRLKVERNTWMEEWYKKNGYEYLSPDGEYDWLEKQVSKEETLKEHNICDTCEESNGCVTPCCAKLLEKQDEQKPTDKVEPKFKVGDTIVEKDLDECGCGTIVNIKDGKYIFDDGCFIRIKEQEGWQLVKTPTIIEQKPAWSEEDEKMLNRIIEEIRPFGECPDYPTDEDREYYYSRAKMIDWLKSLKPNHWKPSEEQLNALKQCIGGYYSEEADKKLELLYDDLKTLI